MNRSEKLHQNISDYNQVLLEKIEVNKKQIIPGEIFINPGNCIYDTHSFFREDFQYNALQVKIALEMC